MVGIIKNIVIIAIAFDFCTGLDCDQVDPGWDIVGPGHDMNSGYVLKVFFNLAQFSPGRDLHDPNRDYNIRP